MDSLLSFPVRLFHPVGIEPTRASSGLRFAGPPDNPGQPDFPGPVRNLGIFFPGAFPAWRGLSADSHAPRLQWFAPGLVPSHT